MHNEHITIRIAGPAHHRMLLAERYGAQVAAMSLASGKVAAEPVDGDDSTIRTLRKRRYEIMRQGGSMAPARALLRRLVPSR